MGEIKSAHEIAMERIATIGEATDSERLKWKYFPKGEELALRFLKKKADLAKEIQVSPREGLPYVKQGAESVLLDSILLPLNELKKATSELAMEGILALKRDNSAASRVIAQIEQIFTHYAEQGAEQRKQARLSLKKQYEQKFKQAFNRQTGEVTAAEELGINVETLPQFQEEWRRTVSQLDEQYMSLLGEFKNELKRIE